MSDSAQIRNLRHLFEVLVRFRWRTATAGLLTCGLVMSASLLLPRKYRGGATFERRTDVVMSSIVNRGMQTPYQDPRESLRHDLLGPHAMEQAIAELAPQFEALRERGVHLDLERLKNEAPLTMRLRFEVATNELDRIRLEYVGPQPQAVRLLVNQLVASYIARSEAQMADRLTTAGDFFREEVARTRGRIEELEDRLLTFQMEKGKLLPETPGGVTEQTATLRRDLEELNEQIASTAIKIRTLRAKLAETPRLVPEVVRRSNPERTRQIKRLRSLVEEFQQARVVEKMTHKHPEVASLRERILSLRARIDELPREVVAETRERENPRHGSLEIRLAEAEAQRRALTERRSRLTERLAGLAGESDQIFAVRSEYRRLESDLGEAKRQLAFWEDNLRKIRISSTAEDVDRGVSFAFIDPCPPIRKPVSPELVQVLLAAAGLGLAAAAVSAFLGHRADESYHRVEHLAESTRLPLIGTVGELMTAQQRRLRGFREYLLYPAHVTVLALIPLAMAAVLRADLQSDGEPLGPSAKPAETAGRIGSSGGASEAPRIAAGKRDRHVP